MSDDDLRARLRRTDPAARGGSDESAGDARAESLLEAIMSTPLDTPSPAEAPPATRRTPTRRWLVPVGAAAAVGGIALAATLLGGTGSDAPNKTNTATPLKLTAPDPTVMASCLMFDVEILKGMSPAFGGTVTDASDGKVVIDVDRWFSPKDSDVTTVELTSPVGSMVSIDGIEFEKGKRYLVTAAEGTVNTCGYTGLATAEYEQKFEAAFGT
ncbi:MAG TPA: hypothetical protein VNA12_08975 [Mycobacteriales bacterium]|nr:hypothetical protein [Mycobacteriales bacterium]